MPAQPSWHPRVPEILATLRAPGGPPFLDRPAFERLFQVRRRQAIRLMGHTGGYQVGKTFLVARDQLVAYLEQLQQTGVVDQACRRKQRVLAAIDQVSGRAGARQAQIRTDPEALRRRPPELPAAIELLAPGKLQITYRGAEDLLAQIVELAAAAANDFPRFQEIFEGRS